MSVPARLFFRLCAETMDNYDPKINNTHLQECLKRLLVLYAGTVSLAPPQNYGTFMALYLLFNLGCNDAILLALQRRWQIG